MGADPERGPAALLPAWAARLVGFAALACLGVAQWQRMAAGSGTARALLWVAIGVVAAAGVLACERLPGRRRSWALIGTAVLALLVAYVGAGMDLGLLRPRRIDELGSGLVSGAQALSTVSLPYGGADPWPANVLSLLGSGLVTVSALLAFWPRRGGRGYPFLALAALLVLVAAPVVSLGGTRSLWLGAGLTLLTVCFLWLERLPLRPGLGVAALIGLALAGALPLAAAADRGQPWFDYQAFAEGLGPKDPVRFDWDHGSYGPITWSRTGAEVVRVRASRPSYWKVRTLDEFDGTVWDSGGYDRASDDPTLDLPANWQSLKRYEDRIQVSIQRLEGTDVVGAGTTRAIANATRPIEHGLGPGEWESVGDLRSGDSYSADVFVPRPTPDQLEAVAAEPVDNRLDDLQVRVHFVPLTAAQLATLPADVPRSPITGQPPDSAVIDFGPYGHPGSDLPIADYRAYGTAGNGDFALGMSQLARTWKLAQQLKAGTKTPYEYVLRVSDYLKKGFTYTEKPPPPAPGVTPLESFLLDTKAGYCQHFSGAMALLLRMGGVPARVATGFTPGGYSKRKQAWIVRDTDAHSWVEAWFDGYGWVTLDPTPSATPARSQIATIARPTSTSGSAAGGANPAGGAAGGDVAANRRAAGSREELFNSLRSNGGARGGTATEDGTGPGSSSVPAWPLVPIVLLAAVAGVVSARRRRPPRPHDPLDRVLYELERALRRSGRQTPAGTTLLQLERRLGLSGEAAGYLRAISAARYSADAKPPTNEQRRALRRELASGQGWAGRLRTFWALPPRAR
ncbi:MAG: protein-glutamine gamma-glutamyltransferase [Solirubrobacteraceae bacterium]|nr:protein-glutamine gamma-glutamyltransferase [Solirubrobacteraceae bacterium]